MFQSTPRTSSPPPLAVCQIIFSRNELVTFKRASVASTGSVMLGCLAGSPLKDPRLKLVTPHRSNSPKLGQTVP